MTFILDSFEMLSSATVSLLKGSVCKVYVDKFLNFSTS